MDVCDIKDNKSGPIKVAAAIIVKEVAVLVARRRDGLHLAGYWEFPGGKIELGETPEQCLVRELKEELGIQCVIDSFLAESIHRYSKKTVQLLGYRGEYFGGTFRLVDHVEVRWMTIDENLLAIDWAPADIPLVVKTIEAVHSGREG